MSVVSPFAAPREIADALNRIASKIGAGDVVLSSASSTSFSDARVSPRSAVLLSAITAGGGVEGIIVQAGDGVATLIHGEGRAGEGYRYVVVNL